MGMVFSKGMRWLSLLACAWLFVASSLALAAPKKPKPIACDRRFTALVGEASFSSEAANTITKLIDKRFPGNFTWLEGKKRGARLEQLYQNLLSLTEVERARLLTQLKSVYSDLDEVPLLVRIGLNEESGWAKFLNESTTEATDRPLMLGDLRPFIDRMPESTRKKLLASIGKQYPDAGKRPQGEKPDFRMFPKRLLDGWLRVLLKGDERFAAGIKAGKPALDAYQDYLDDVNGLVFKSGGVKKGFSQISARDVLALAEEAQKFLRLPTTQEQLYKGIWDENRKPLPPVLRFYGSMIKGTAKPNSDLDMGYFNLEYYRDFNFLKGGERRGVQVPGLGPLLEASVEKRHPGFGLRAYSTPHTFNMVEQASSLETFMVEVTPDSINLLVYDRNITLQPVYPGGPLIYQAPAPTRYRLK